MKTSVLNASQYYLSFLKFAENKVESSHANNKKCQQWKRENGCSKCFSANLSFLKFAEMTLKSSQTNNKKCLQWKCVFEMLLSKISVFWNLLRTGSNYHRPIIKSVCNENECFKCFSVISQFSEICWEQGGIITCQ